MNIVLTETEIDQLTKPKRQRAAQKPFWYQKLRLHSERKKQAAPRPQFNESDTW